ncbi:hypothetical protein CNECB9_4260006 [Cupriavidus necator]|uniref:LysR substrate-binding domain-containing protein n=1 Tax=Cupriavidus necator TaxID=106590 RepID=A0A1K0IKT1_CUPNE|nr:hypothetical protein CNECB9_4260006 [Cupriavidus necator]
MVMELDDRLVDMGYERYDVAIRITRLGDSALIARRLAVSRRIVCCSPAYAERAGPPASLDDITRHACLSYSNSPPSQVWAFRGPTPQATPKVITPRGLFTANNGPPARRRAGGPWHCGTAPVYRRGRPGAGLPGRDPARRGAARRRRVCGLSAHRLHLAEDPHAGAVPAARDVAAAVGATCRGRHPRSGTGAPVARLSSTRDTPRPQHVNHACCGSSARALAAAARSGTSPA